MNYKSKEPLSPTGLGKNVAETYRMSLLEKYRDHLLRKAVVSGILLALCYGIYFVALFLPGVLAGVGMVLSAGLVMLFHVTPTIVRTFEKDPRQVSKIIPGQLAFVALAMIGALLGWVIGTLIPIPLLSPLLAAIGGIAAVLLPEPFLMDRLADFASNLIQQKMAPTGNL
jgi:hypothetical protein